MLSNIRSFVLRRGGGSQETVVEVGFVHALWDMATTISMSDYSLVMDDRFLCASIVYGLVSAWKKSPRSKTRDDWFRLTLEYLVRRWNHRLHSGWDWNGVDAITKQWYDMQSKWGSMPPSRAGDGAEGAGAPARGGNIILEASRDGVDHADLALHVRILKSFRDRFHGKLATDKQRRKPLGEEREERQCCQNSLCARGALSSLVMALEGLIADLADQRTIVMVGHGDHTSTVIRASIFEASDSPSEETAWLCRLLFGEDTNPGPRRLIRETDGGMRLHRTCTVSQTLGKSASIGFVSVEPRSLVLRREELERRKRAEEAEREELWANRRSTILGAARRRGGPRRGNDSDEDDANEDAGARDGPFSVVRDLVRMSKEGNKRRRSRMRCSLWCCCFSMCKLVVFVFGVLFFLVALMRMTHKL